MNAIARTAQFLREAAATLATLTIMGAGPLGIIAIWVMVSVYSLPFTTAVAAYILGVLAVLTVVTVLFAAANILNRRIPKEV